MSAVMILFEDTDMVITETNVIEFKFSKNRFDKSFVEFLKKYPEYVATTVRLGTNAIQSYKTAKNSTARFYGKTPFEKDINKNMVDVLCSSGKFRLVTKKFKDSGIFYELVRV